MSEEQKERPFFIDFLLQPDDDVFGYGSEMSIDMVGFIEPTPDDYKPGFILVGGINAIKIITDLGPDIMPTVTLMTKRPNTLRTLDYLDMQLLIKAASFRGALIYDESEVGPLWIDRYNGVKESEIAASPDIL